MTGLLELSARDLLARYASGEASPVDAVDEVAERSSAVDGRLGAFTTLCLERARFEAHASEQAYRRGDPQGPLAGVPLGVKDLFDSEGVRTTYGSPMCADHVPAADAEALRRARAAGAILVGKTQTHEWAWGISSVNELMGTSHNPWALDRISGGSSGGSAVALASHQVTLALGSDTGGSIRVPSALCGTVGFKPTYGRVSTAGIWPLARTLDHPGPMARTPADAALLLEVIAGWDPADPATADVPLGDMAAALAQGLEGRVVGICPDMHLMPLTPAAAERIRRGGRGGDGPRRAHRGGAHPGGERRLRRVRGHAAGRGPAHARRGRALPGARRRVRGRRARPARAGRERGHPRLPARRRGAPADARGVRARVHGGRPDPDAGQPGASGADRQRGRASTSERASRSAIS